MRSYKYLEWEPDYISYIDFCEIYELNQNTMYSRLSQLNDKELKSIIYVDNKIDIGFLVELNKFNQNIKNCAHEYYYYIREFAKSDLELSRYFAEYIDSSSVANINRWLSSDFWVYHTTDTLDLCFIQDRFIKFVEWSELIIPKLELYRLRSGYDGTTNTKENN